MKRVVDELNEFGPAQIGPGVSPPMDEASARAWCQALAEGHYENFSVLSALVPTRMRGDFAAVYAFCRWADDLGDEAGSPGEERLQLLAWWRGELQACFDGAPRHPVFVALRPTVVAYKLSIEPFTDLISAFEEDQVKVRYATWDELDAYCRRSADPVGRLVLSVFGLATQERFTLSDRVCTALQLVNHVQDVRRDLLDRDRIYLPAECTAAIPNFESRLRRTAELGYACDQQFLSEYRAAVRPMVDRCWKLLEEGRTLLPTLTDEAHAVIRLFIEGGERLLGNIEAWNLETCIHRPKLSRTERGMLVMRAWWGARAPRWMRVGGPARGMVSSGNGGTGGTQ